MSEQAKCTLCGHPMPPGEQMFKFHGFSGPCPGPPLKPSPQPSGEGPYRAGEYGQDEDGDHFTPIRGPDGFYWEWHEPHGADIIVAKLNTAFRAGHASRDAGGAGEALAKCVEVLSQISMRRNGGGTWTCGWCWNWSFSDSCDCSMAKAARAALSAAKIAGGAT